MKRAISPIGAACIVVALLFVIGLTTWKFTSEAPPGPSPEEVAKHTGAQSIRDAMASGPPPGPPMPGSDRRMAGPHNH